MRTAWAVLLAIAPAAGTAAGDFVLSQPIDCVLGETCHIQQYVDHDPSPGAIDYLCGSLSYDGHKGTDFALPTKRDMVRGVDVLAAAAGVVAGVRDGMEDHGYSEETAQEIQGRECGNGVLLRHGGGWETQYCHMKAGSVGVRKGMHVKAGTVLGQVGLSGRTEFPHLHLSVRHNGDVVDPFSAAAGDDCGPPADSLWANPPVYHPGGLISAGFAAAIPGFDAIKEGVAARSVLASDSSGLVLFGYGYGARKGDVMEIEITGPGRPILSQVMEINRNQAQFFRAAGKRLDGTSWPAGAYQGTVRLRRGDTVIDQKTVQVDIP
ncbi:MAG: M23 family metallopeptidase [Planctomycetes bacterium]|nr:M23 family metallopeptidase [Planctomycetota bacterium]